MFNLFKKKYKRSDWMEGILWAEANTQQGLIFECLEYQPAFWNTKRTYYIARNNPSDQFVTGVYDYLRYYENILINL